MKQKYISKYILVLLGLLIAFAIYMQYSAMQSTIELKLLEVNKTKQYAQNIVNYIKQRVPKDLDKKLQQDKMLRHELNSVLQAFMTDRYKYIFVLDKPNDKYYRFLLDGSTKSKEDFHSIFLPKSPIYNEVYNNKHIQIIKQKDSIENVWISVLAPIVYDNKTKALLVLDLSKEYGEYLESFNSPLIKLINLMQIFLFVSIIVLLILFYRYYKFRKNVLIDKTTQAFTRQYLDEFFSENNLSDYHAIMIDIDEFRVINTKFGYEVGNKVLYEFVTYLKEVIQEYQSEFVFRISGGE
ncbi:MAG: diguanylate cyclase, partial [Campylobacterales bacterium]